MYQIKVNDKHQFELATKNGEITYKDAVIAIDYQSIEANSVHVLYKNKSYRVEIIEHIPHEKVLFLKINSRDYKVQLTDQYDELLHRLGLDNISSAHISEIKAPMPGLVLNILVKEGAEISKGDNMIILEAMKMENIIKSPIDGIVKSVKVKTGDKLEKNQVMVSFI